MLHPRQFHLLIPGQDRGYGARGLVQVVPVTVVVQCNQTFDALLHRRRQIVVRGVLVGEQRVAAALRHFDRIEQGAARRHPVTGRRALYSVSGSSFGIEGMPEDEAVGLLDELKRHATQEKYQLRLKYGVGDLVIWDNASLLHSATLTDPEDPRTLWRITVKEERKP